MLQVFKACKMHKVTKACKEHKEHKVIKACKAHKVVKACTVCKACTACKACKACTAGNPHQQGVDRDSLGTEASLAHGLQQAEGGSVICPHG